jgi:DNA-binding transcriptional regulator PaaX
MLHAFRGFPFLDPELPEAMPVADRRARVVATFDTVYELLVDKATAYFADVAHAESSAARPPDVQPVSAP